MKGIKTIHVYNMHHTFSSVIRSKNILLPNYNMSSILKFQISSHHFSEFFLFFLLFWLGLAWFGFIPFMERIKLQHIQSISLSCSVASSECAFFLPLFKSVDLQSWLQNQIEISQMRQTIMVILKIVNICYFWQGRASVENDGI